MTITFNIIRLILVGVFIVAFFQISEFMSMDTYYRANMPKLPTMERPLELTIGHNRKVFVNQNEYDKYVKYSGRINPNELAGVLAAFALALITLARNKLKTRDKIRSGGIH